jgi:hypothetical protein
MHSTDVPSKWINWQKGEVCRLEFPPLIKNLVKADGENDDATPPQI